MKKTVTTVKNFVVKNKTKLIGAIAIGLTAEVIFQKGLLNSHDEFLRLHDLYNEFYAISAEITE